MASFSTIAVLLTCHNRKEKTLNCLSSLYACIVPENYLFEVFLVDDGSTDGTSIEVKSKYPLVNVIEGTGDLFWNQGMRLAWQNAIKVKDYDFYLWLNDDTLLDKDSLIKIIEVYIEAKDIEKKEVIITGACRKELNDNSFSYGGRINSGPVYPNGQIQRCKFINGNAVLVPKEIYQKIGILSNDYTHGMGDFDYGLQVLKNGFFCYTTKDYIAICSPNEGIPGWCNPGVPLKKRWELLRSPRGLNIKEYIKFRKKFWGTKWIIYAIKAYAKMINPKLYQYISK